MIEFLQVLSDEGEASMATLSAKGVNVNNELTARPQDCKLPSTYKTNCNDLCKYDGLQLEA